MARLAIVVAIAASACVSAPAPAAHGPDLRVLPGGVGSGRLPTPIPTQSFRPEPPIGVVFAGRVVLPCTYVRCTPRAQLVALGSGDGVEPLGEPVSTPLPLAPIPTRAGTGFGPTARVGNVLDNEPRVIAAQLQPGPYRVEVYTTVGDVTRLRDVGATRLACSLEFVLTPGQAVSFDVAFDGSGSGPCRIDLAPAFVTR